MEIAIAMLAQESSPHQYIRDLDVFCHFLCVRLAWAHSAELALPAHGAAGCGRGVEGADGVEDVREVWCGGFDLARDILVTVVEDVVCSAALDQIVVLGAAGRQDLQPLEFGELDGVLSDACWSGGQRVRLSRVTV